MARWRVVSAVVGNGCVLMREPRGSRVLEAVRLVRPRDRRVVADRRAQWRGGRRDVDWLTGLTKARVVGAMPSDEDAKPEQAAGAAWTAHFLVLNHRVGADRRRRDE